MMMFEFNVCNKADEEIFYKQCQALENNVPNILLSKELIDVDGSISRTYEVNGKKVNIYNDVNVDAVYIKSEEELQQYFK